MRARRVAGAVGLALGLAAAVLYVRPIRLTPDEAELPAALPTGTEAPCDVVLVADPDAVHARWSERFEECDWAFGWASWLEQSFGPWRLERPGALALDDARIVVVPEHAWGDLRDPDLDVLGRFAARGGVVIAEGAPLDMDLGSDTMVAVPAGFAADLVRAQQGWWEPGVAVPPHPGVAAGLLQPHTLRPAGSPDTAFEPAVDVREAELRGRVDAVAPVPGWWSHPDAAPAFVATTVDEENFGDRSAWIARAFAEEDVGSTMFVVPDVITAGGVAAVTAAGAGVQLHWNRGFFQVVPLDRLGIGPYRPFERRLSLLDQLAALRGRGGCTDDVLLNRNHGLVWDAGFGKTFRMLHAAGVDADSSYGPTGPGVLGYIFGTGLPFRPLDAGGWPFPFVEVPFQYQDDEEFSRAAQRRLIEEAVASYHTVVVPTFHANTMSRVPSEEAIEGTCELGAVAHAAGAGVGDLDGWVRHWRARLASPLTSTFDGHLLHISYEAAAAGQAIRVPAESCGRQVAAVSTTTRDGAGHAIDDVQRIGDSVVIRVRPDGRPITVSYE